MEPMRFPDATVVNASEWQVVVGVMHHVVVYTATARPGLLVDLGNADFPLFDNPRVFASVGVLVLLAFDACLLGLPPAPGFFQGQAPPGGLNRGLARRRGLPAKIDLRCARCRIR